MAGRADENSGLIDLDALLREMSAHEAPPPEAVVAPAPAPVMKAKVAPAPPDSLEGLTTTASEATVRRAPPAPSVRARSIRPPAPSRRRALLVAAALAVAALAPSTALLRSSRDVTIAPAMAAARAPDEPLPAAPARAPVLGTRADELPSVATTTIAPAAARAPSVSASASAKRAPAAAPTLSERVLEASATSGPGDLGDAMRGAVGPRSAPVAESPVTAGGSALQVRPSQGAVVGALGAVLPSARACLGPDATARSGLVVFASDGSVARVDLGGGKPEDECIRSALRRAKVASFLDDTFATRVTVRP